jgi:hypothetical protein
MATDFLHFTTFEGKDYVLQRYPTKRHVVPSKMQRELAFAARISARAQEMIAWHLGPEVVEVEGGIL